VVAGVKLLNYKIMFTNYGKYPVNTFSLFREDDYGKYPINTFSLFREDDYGKKTCKHILLDWMI
jgi:hypothetical protein